MEAVAALFDEDADLFEAGDDLDALDLDDADASEDILEELFDELSFEEAADEKSFKTRLQEVVSGFPRHQRSVMSLPPAQRAKIDRLARVIVASHRSSRRPIRTVRLIGHADRDIARGQAFERQVSDERALGVQHALVAAINDPRIVQQIGFVRVGAGATQLLVPGAVTEQDRARNRRVVITLAAGRRAQPGGRRRFVRVRGHRIVGVVEGPVRGLAARPVSRALGLRPASTQLVRRAVPPTNIREDVLSTMHRLHLLWSLSNNHYNIEFPIVAALPAGSAVNVRLIPRTIAAIARNQEPTIHNEVARYFLHQPLRQPVGLRLPNLKHDVLRVQDSLRALGLLSDADYTRERAAVAPVMAVADANRVMPRTLTALTNLKDAIAGFRLGWEPLQADESEAGGDRFGGRTFDFTVTTLCFVPGEPRPREMPHNVSVFIPRGATPDHNNVHIFFSPRGAAGDRGDNDVLVQGLRAAAEATRWIVIGVSGVVNGWRTMDSAAITTCLSRAGRPTTITAVRLSGHSRGVSGLAQTLARRRITAPIDRTVILDAPELFQGGGRNVIVYRVNVQNVRVPGAVHRDLPPGCMRAIGYTRLIRNAMVTRPMLAIPPAIRSQLLPILDRGCFRTTAASTLTGCQYNLTDFCTMNTRAIGAIVRRERDPDGLHTFVERNHLLRAGHAVAPGIYSHHVFVAEVAHEFMGG